MLNRMEIEAVKAERDRLREALRECQAWIEHRAGPNPEPADQARIDLADRALAPPEQED